MADDAILNPSTGNRGIHFHGTAQNDVHCFRFLLANNGDIVRWCEQVVLVPPRLDDAGLLSSDFSQGIAEVLRVIKTDRADDGHVGLHHIGRIPCAAHADFHHGDIDRSVGEGSVGHGREDLELAHLRAALFGGLGVNHFHVGLNLAPDAHVVAWMDGLAIYGDALGNQLQMRTGGAATATTESSHQRLNHANSGSLAISAGNVNHRSGTLGMAKDVHQHLDPLE